MKITPDELRSLKEQFVPGTRVKLIKMDDPYNQKLVPGCLGTVRCVDDVGTIHIQWDCGSGLGVVYGVDICKRIEVN